MATFESARNKYVSDSVQTMSPGYVIVALYDYIHSAIDAYSRLAYSEVLPNENGETSAAFWKRAHSWFADHGITVEAILTDNAKAYIVSHAFRDAVDDIEHRRIRAHRPQTNGKVERFNRTLDEEWAYARLPQRV